MCQEAVPKSQPKPHSWLKLEQTQRFDFTKPAQNYSVSKQTSTATAEELPCQKGTHHLCVLEKAASLQVLKSQAKLHGRSYLEVYSEVFLWGRKYSVRITVESFSETKAHTAQHLGNILVPFAFGKMDLR